MDEKYLINLPVFTQSGFFLGRIVDAEKDNQSGVIVKYLVKSTNPIKHLWQGIIQIDQSQVVAINQDKMIVEDNFKKLRKPVMKPQISI